MGIACKVLMRTAGATVGQVHLCSPFFSLSKVCTLSHTPPLPRQDSGVPARHSEGYTPPLTSDPEVTAPARKHTGRLLRSSSSSGVAPPLE